MSLLKKLFSGFTKFEIGLWISSLLLILFSALFCGTFNSLYVAASLIGATALIFVAKGNVTGQILTVLFSIFYGIISFSFEYYGEMITYLCMTAPIATASVVTWIKNPYKNNKKEVAVNKLSWKEYCFIFLLGIIVAVAFYFILKILGTANLIFSTVSVVTSFIAVYFTMKRSAWYALAYALNDIVLIILWIFASVESVEYVSMVVCFSVFLVNDVYGYFNWKKIRKKQQSEE